MAAPSSFKDTKKEYVSLKNFKGVDTKSGRTTINQDEFSWLENAMPIGNGNLRAVPGPSQITGAIWTATPASSFIANIGTVTYAVVFGADGSAFAYNFSSNTTASIASPGKFSTSGVQATMWKNQRLLIIDPVKGYWSWDGTNLVSIGSIGLITVTAGGSGYTQPPTVTFGAPNQTGGLQATGTASVGSGASSVGTVTGVLMTNTGAGYTSVPQVTFSAPSTAGGVTATGGAALSSGAVITVAITNPGSGYTSAPTVTFTGGGFTTAATATASISSGPVTAVTLTEPGTGYTSPPSISFSGGSGSGASATASLISQSGTAIAVFAGRVWIAQGRTIFYTAANSYEDLISVSAGNFTLTDSVLFGNITALVSANSYLYIFGQDSINIVSDVAVNSLGATVFTNTNISASIGSTLPNAIYPYFRSLLLMNSYGIYALVGATTTKISDPLDGVFQSIDFSAPVYAGQFVLNNILCAAFGFSYTDPVLGPRYLIAVFFDKKWWFASQAGNYLHILSVPVPTGIALYGLTSTGMFQFFSSATNPVLTTIQTALMSFNSPVQDKQVLKLGVETTGVNGILSVNVENEVVGSAPYQVNFTPTNTVQWINNSSQVVGWENNLTQAVQWLSGFPYLLLKSDVSQYGKYVGLTATITDPQFVLNGLLMQYEMRATF